MFEMLFPARDSEPQKYPCQRRCLNFKKTVRGCRKWNPALPDARVSPIAPRIQGTFAAGSFHYTVHSVAGASRARTANLPPRTKGQITNQQTKLPCHTSKRSMQS